jgi:hypothetical protein
VVIVRTVQDTYHVFPPDFHEFIRQSTGKRYVSAKISDFALGSHVDRVKLIHDALTTKVTQLMTSAPEAIAEGKAA